MWEWNIFRIVKAFRIFMRKRRKMTIIVVFRIVNVFETYYICRVVKAFEIFM